MPCIWECLAGECMGSDGRLECITVKALLQCEALRKSSVVVDPLRG